MSSPPAPAVAPLSRDDARVLTNEIRSDAQTLWLKLLRAYEGDAHGSLGYSSWADYCATEFAFGKTRSYRLLQAARVIAVAELPMGNSTIPNERVARELAPLLDDPHTLRKTHAQAVATAPVGPSGDATLTAGHVRSVVQKRNQNSSATKPGSEASGTTIRPDGDIDNEPEIPTLNAAVATLKHSVSRDLDDVDDALEMLKRSADLGLYRPKNDAPAAFNGLVEIVGALVERVRGECS